MAEYLSPPLTTIAMPLSEVGAAGVDILVELLDGAPGALAGARVRARAHPARLDRPAVTIRGRSRERLRHLAAEAPARRESTTMRVRRLAWGLLGLCVALTAAGHGVRGPQSRRGPGQHARLARVRRAVQRRLPRVPGRRRADRVAGAAQRDRLDVPGGRARPGDRLRVPRLRHLRAGRGAGLAAGRRPGGPARRPHLGAEPAGRDRAAVPALPARAAAVAALAARRLADRRGDGRLRRRDRAQSRALLLPRRRQPARRRGHDHRRRRRGRRASRSG